MSSTLRTQNRKERNASYKGSGNSLDTLHSAGRRQERSPSPYGRKTPRNVEVPTEEFIDIPSAEQIDPRRKLETFLKDALAEYSRQRLRAVHMSLRRYSNVEARISQKDLQQAFQENQVKVSNRLFQMMFDIFEDHVGVDYEQLYKCLTAAHNKTGRDSVLARHLRNDLAAHTDVTVDKQDTDFIRRIEEMLIKDKVFFDIDALRKDFQSWDSTRTGKISKESVMLICNDRTPLYGALLKNLAKRCDVDKTDQVSWPEFLNFLDKAQQRAWLKVPELSKLPEKARQEKKTAVYPNPIEELSTNARSRVVSKLLRRREKSNLSNADKGGVSLNKAETEREISNLSSKSAETTKTSKKMMEVEHVPVIEVENTSNTVSENTVQSETSLKRTAAQSGDETTTATTAEVKKTESVKNISENKRQDKDSLKESQPELSGNSVNRKNISTENNKQLNKIQDVTADAESDCEPELISPSDVIVNIHEKNVRIFRPSSYSDNKHPIDPPRERLQLDWIYGYRGHDCRMNIHILANEEICYFICNTVILYSRVSHTQRHYRDHTQYIKCMAVHSNGNIIASGQCSSKDNSVNNLAVVRVWRADTLQTLHVLGSGMFTKAVTSIAFPLNADLFASVDQSLEKRLTVWDTNDGRLVADTTINIDVVCSVGFNPVDRNLLVTVGKEHIGWWKLYPETHTIQKFAKPDYENYLRARFVICQTHTERGDLITGDSNGTIYIWGSSGNRITNFIKHGHECPVFTVLYYKHHILTGGRDGTLECWQWNKNMDNAGSLTLPQSEGGVRMLCHHRDSLLVGTTMNSILSLTLAGKGSPLEGAQFDQLPITQGHFDDVRGLQTIARSFTQADFITAGVDGVICKYNSEQHQPVWKIVMKETTFLCIDCSSDGKLLTLGTHDGHLVILELNPADLSVTQAFNMKLTKERLDTIKLSPDCMSIAVGGHDKAIYIFSLVEREDTGAVWEMQGKCKGHHGSVVSMDWSADRYNGDYYLKSSSSAFDQRFWNVGRLEAVQGNVCEEMKWASDQCIVDHKLIGLWGSKQGRESIIHAVDVNSSKSVVAMGDSRGYLSLFRYPCSKPGVFSHTYKCHQTVFNTRFSPSDNYVLTVGGKDCCVMQWKIV